MKAKREVAFVRRFGVVVAAICLMGSSFAASSALAMGYGGRHGGFRHDPLFRLIHKLNLSDGQKQQVAGILKQNEASARTIVTNLANARVQLAKDVLTGADISLDFQAVSNYALQAAQLRTQIMSEIMPVLTKDQQTTIQNMVQKIGKHTDDAINARFARWDKWIAKHSQ